MAGLYPWPWPWPANAGPYRTVDNLDQPWVPSPVIPALMTRPYLPERSGYYPHTGPSPHANLTGRDLAPPRFTGFWRWLRACIIEAKSSSCHRRFPSRHQTPHRLRPSDWKAYTYWARPIVNDVPVNNYPNKRRRGRGTTTTKLPPPPGTTTSHSVDPRKVFSSLRGRHNSPHPERWVPGLQHPALPPRPTLWRSPQPPPPPPWECQLNPFLEHRSIGVAPLYFDIGRETTGILFAEPASTIPMEEGNRAQPATYPLLTHMRIRGVADDSSPTFPWPITVHNPDGITCQDVFNAIYRNFREHVTGDEYAAWSSRRREQSSRAYHIRVRSTDTWNPEQSLPVNDGLRRIDYMGERVMFRGLEPSPNRDPSWIMFVGPA